MNGFQLSVFDVDAPRAERMTPYARRQRELEEQAFYERFGARPVWDRLSTPTVATVVGTVVTVGAILVALKETLGS